MSGEPHPPAPPSARPSPSRAMAGWALGLALLPLGVTWLVGAVLAVVVLARSTPTRDRGRDLAAGALAAAGTWLVLTVLLGGVVALVALSEPVPVAGSSSATLSRDPSIKAGNVPVDDLVVGDCLADRPPTGAVDVAYVVPCETPHRTEVYAVVDLPGTRYPGEAEVRRLSRRGCGRALTEVDLDAHPRLRVSYLRPLNQAGFRTDPTATCLVFGAMRRGSVRLARPGSGAV